MDDRLYYMIKNYHFDKIGRFLSKRFQYQQKFITESKKENDIKAIGRNVVIYQQIKEERNTLSNHLDIASYISKNSITPRAKRRLQLEQTILSGEKGCLDFIHDYYETEMARKGDPYELLKLFCLESLIQNGINWIYNLYM